MESQLINFLMQEKTAELRAEFAAQQAKLQAELHAKLQAELEARYRAETAEMQAQLQIQTISRELEQALQKTLVARFPQVPPALLLAVQEVTQPTLLSKLNVAAVQVADIAEFERAFREITAA